MSRRIALVSLHTSPLATAGSGDAGGMNVYLVGLAGALRARGYEVELLTRDTGDPDARDPHARTVDGVPVRFLRAGPRASVPKARLAALTGEFGRAMSELPAFDLVHSHYWLSGAAALPVAQGWGVPHVLSLHTVAAAKNEHLAPGDEPEPAERLRAEAALVRDSDLTVAATQAERAAILQATEAAPGRVAVVTPGVDTHLFHPVPAATGPAPVQPVARDDVSAHPATWKESESGSALPRDDRPTVLALARIQPLKGVDLAIRAVGAIPRGRRPRLVIAGGTSPGHEAYASGLHGLVTALALHDDVSFLPAQSRADAAALVREATLLLVPSHSETYGLVALEAAASATPVVAACTGGLVESVLDGVSGMLVDDRSPDAWGRAIDDLLHDPARLADLEAGALRHGRTHSWPHTAEHLAAFYDDLLERNSRHDGPEWRA
ncbi:glycosyltransferase [Herbiconiux ginsengi]|uniref:D-inositol 3-phosphate glycosyltransferase n=1 Tax=Herbiconiux ginsengi TaxID=381665 RepID=A0A1H3M7C0_9MICO|nr:glycosyltransferase [Herbiconiux ginsengi]SDY72621.1 D-inositol-3-phosphate glycosyltransferase [Herbiconiux ginsengi]